VTDHEQTTLGRYSRVAIGKKRWLNRRLKGNFAGGVRNPSAHRYAFQADDASSILVGRSRTPLQVKPDI
jgi:hypothetical protein